MIEAFTGLPGEGKTYNMVRQAYKQHKRGRKVYANFNTTFATYYKELDEIYHVKNALILMDEAGIYLPAQAWNKIPFEFMRSIRQHRKGGNDWWYTAQDMLDVSTSLRRVTQFQHDFEKFLNIFTEKVRNPKTKESYGTRFIIFKQEIGDLYDTNDEVEFSKFMNLKN